MQINSITVFPQIAKKKCRGKRLSKNSFLKPMSSNGGGLFREVSFVWNRLPYL